MGQYLIRDGDSVVYKTVDASEKRISSIKKKLTSEEWESLQVYFEERHTVESRD